MKETFTFLVGGKAGEGVKKAGQVAARLFADMGRSAIEMDDYMSLIKGGHNFSIVSTAVREITSHYLKAELAVARLVTQGHADPGTLLRLFRGPAQVPVQFVQLVVVRAVHPGQESGGVHQG